MSWHALLYKEVEDPGSLGDKHKVCFTFALQSHSIHLQ